MSDDEPVRRCMYCAEPARWRCVMRMLTGLWYPLQVFVCDRCKLENQHRTDAEKVRAEREIEWRRMTYGECNGTSF